MRHQRQKKEQKKDEASARWRTKEGGKELNAHAAMANSVHLSSLSCSCLCMCQSE